MKSKFAIQKGGNQIDNGEGSYRRFLDGDKNGLAEIIEAYHEGLTLYINSIVNSISDAEEIMQETFVKIAINKPKFRGRSQFKTWLFAIGRNGTLNYLKKRSKISYTPIEDYSLSDETEMELKYLKKEQYSKLRMAMKKIYPEYSNVLYLKYFEDFKTDDTAEILHKSKRQTENLLFQAQKTLRKELEKAGFQYEEF